MQAAIRPGSPAPAIGPGTVTSIVLLAEFPTAVAVKLYLVVTEYGSVLAIAVRTGPNVSAPGIGPLNVWEPSDVTPAPDVLNNRFILSCQACRFKTRAAALIICRHGIAEDIGYQAANYC